MQRFILVGILGMALLWLASAQHVHADTSESYDFQGVKQYGNCSTLTGVDMFTDDREHMVSCGEETLTDKTTIVVSKQRGRFIIAVGKGSQLHFGQTIPIAIRVDKGPVIVRKARWSSDSMMGVVIGDGRVRSSPRDELAAERMLAISLLDQLAAGSRVAIRVGKERGHIILDGSAAAIDDFRARIGEDESPGWQGGRPFQTPPNVLELD